MMMSVFILEWHTTCILHYLASQSFDLECAWRQLLPDDSYYLTTVIYLTTVNTWRQLLPDDSYYLTTVIRTWRQLYTWRQLFQKRVVISKFDIWKFLFNYNSASSLKQQSAVRHDAPRKHMCQTVLLLNAAYVAGKQQIIMISCIFVFLHRGGNPRFSALEASTRTITASIPLTY